MRWPRSVYVPSVALLVSTLILTLFSPPASRGQLASPPAEPGKPVGDSVEAIEAVYNTQLLRLEKERLEQLARLAARQNPAESAATYEKLFRLAILNNLFREAEPTADVVATQGSPSPTTMALANLVRIIAESDRGAYDQSLENLRQVSAARSSRAAKGESVVSLSPGEIVAICEAYYERLIEGGRFDVARKAFSLIEAKAASPAVREYVAGRLQRLDLVGKVAPPIVGTDLDGKPFSLADEQGKVVLVTFWATWCLPNATEAAWLRQALETYKEKGLRVVGINLDNLSDLSQKPEVVQSSVRRFLLDQNINWTNIINGSGDKDYARSYAVTDIPSNVLIGRDGKIIYVDLTRKNLESVIARAIKP